MLKRAWKWLVRKFKKAAPVVAEKAADAVIDAAVDRALDKLQKGRK